MFVNAKLNNNLKEAPAEVKENREYIRGGAVLSAKDPCRFKFFVHRNLACHKSIEVSYYSTKCVRLSSVCFYCGVMYGAELTNKNAIKELLKLHVDIRWICTFCKIIRRTPVTRGKVSGKHLLHEVSNFQKRVKCWSHVSFGSFLSYKVLLCLHLNLHLIKTDDMSSCYFTGRPQVFFTFSPAKQTIKLGLITESNTSFFGKVNVSVQCHIFIIRVCLLRMSQYCPIAEI